MFNFIRRKWKIKGSLFFCVNNAKQWYQYMECVKEIGEIPQWEVSLFWLNLAITWYGHYEFLVMLFDFINAPTIFMDLIN
jgi:hypothetical protein